MDLNQQMLSDLAAQLGLEDNAQSAVKAAVDVANDYKNKNEDVLITEIRELKKIMKNNPAQYQKQITAIKTLRSVMNPEQQRRLDKMIRLLEE
ncbi:MAG: hypothetical protein GXX92_02560 [Clostridiales bacterium]|jgi:hypothetical protein|nr:hypothetical protein [Clostridiales bacterium]